MKLKISNSAECSSTETLSARGVNFAYQRGAPVLCGVDLTAATGRFLCILGPNGSGKTTLLKCLLNQLKPDAGSIVLAGKPVRKYSPRALAKMLAYVPQVPVSAFDFSVRELVLMGRLSHTGAMGLAGKEDYIVAELAMNMTQTLEFADRTLQELSGGEAQRVMIARALAQQPRVCLLDEPTSHLDIKNQLMIYKMMQRLAHDWKMAVVCVSHDVNMAGRFADELILMRRGKVVACGSPANVVKEDILSEVYEVGISLMTMPGEAMPIVLAR